MFSLTSEPLYMKIPYNLRDWAKEHGLKYDGDAKSWYLPAGRDPLPFRDEWSYLEKTYEARNKLKRMGCRYNPNLKKWYVPEKLDFDNFTEWWPDDLRQYLFCGRYAVHELYGEKSGQANVYKAWDIVEDSGYFAVKIYKNLDELTEFTANTQKNAANAELKALEKLKGHQNILELADIEYREDTKSICMVSRWMEAGNLENLIGLSEEEELNRIFKAMERLGYDFEDDAEGQILKEVQTGQRDSWIENSGILIGILEGLNHAHKLGIYHRDLKPANVLIDIDSILEKHEIIPLICDFGAAKIREPTDPGITDPNYTLVGIRTPNYRWPSLRDTEEGIKEHENQNTWDIVSWGIMAIQMLSNEKVETPNEALKFLNEKLVEDFDPEIIELLNQAISKDPEQRPKDIEEFLKKIIDFTERRKEAVNWEC